MGEPIEGYDGETAERKPWLALALSLVAPGLGWIYLGRASVAVALNVIAVSLWAVFVVGLAALRFHPAVPTAVFALGAILLNLLTALDARREARRVGSTYVLEDVNHPIVYAALFVFSYALPLAAIAGIAHGAVVRSVIVSDDASWPTLVAGDRVFVDMSELRSRPPQHAGLVAYEAPDGSGPRFSRVVAVAGEQLLVVHGLPVLDDTPLAQGEPGGGQLAAIEAVAGPSPAELDLLIETDGRRSYAVALPSGARWGEAESWEIPADHVFLLNDNRGNLSDSRSYGAIPVDRLLGVPRFVSFSPDASAPPWFLALPPPLQHVAARLDPVEPGSSWRQERTARRIPAGSAR